MQCKSGYAQAGQNKKRRADARLSWDGVGKLLLLSLLDNGDLEVVVVELAVLELLGHLDFLDLNIGIFETGDQFVEILLFHSPCRCYGRSEWPRTEVAALFLFSAATASVVTFSASPATYSTGVVKKLLALQPW